METPMLLKVNQAAALLGIGRSTAYALIAQGELPCIRVGSSMRVPRAALEAWIERATLNGPDLTQADSRNSQGRS